MHRGREHHLAVVDHLCAEVAVIFQGRIVEQGTPETLFRNAAHPYTRALLDAVPVVGSAHSAALSINRVLPEKAATSAT
jgi:peptide/nickel transport system ATP-binding protein